MMRLVVIAALLLCAATLLSAQVSAVVELHGRDAELRVRNPTSTALSVSISLYRDATKDGGPVTLGDSVSARISPASFTLQPGNVQTVRIRVREPVESGELLRLATMFTPIEADSTAGMRLRVRTRLITKVQAAP